MARIAGVMLPPNKKVEFALPYIYGIGRTLGLKILKTANIDPAKRAKDLSENEVGKLQNIIEKNYRIEGDLRREKLLNIKLLKEIGSYRGMRHSRGLPVRGKRTRTNSRTVRGNVRRTAGSGRKVSAEKT